MRSWITWAWHLQRLKNYRNLSRRAWNYSIRTTECTSVHTESKSLDFSKWESVICSFEAITEASKRSSHCVCSIFMCMSRCKEAVTVEPSSIKCFNTNKLGLKSWHMTGQVTSCSHSSPSISDSKSTFLKTTTSLYTMRTLIETTKFHIKMLKTRHYIKMVPRILLLTIDSNKLIIVNTISHLTNNLQSHKGRQVTAVNEIKRTWETRASRTKLAQTWITFLVKVTSKTCCLHDTIWTTGTRASHRTLQKENWDLGNYQTLAFRYWTIMILGRKIGTYKPKRVRRHRIWNKLIKTA